MNETRQLAEWVTGHRPGDIPEDIAHEAKRALLNYLAAAFGGCRHEAVDIAVRSQAALHVLPGVVVTLHGTRCSIRPLRSPSC